MNAKFLQSYFLVGLIAVSSVLVFFIFRPFLVALVLAAVFATVLHPLYERLRRRMSGSPGFASFLTIVIALVCILVPLGFIGTQIATDAQRLYVSFSDEAGRTYLTEGFQYVNGIAERFGFSLSTAELSASLDQYIKNVLQWLIENLGGAFGGITRFIIDLFIFLIALYYLLRDGLRLKQIIIAASPLADADDNIVLEKLQLSINSIIRGSLIIALIQGTLTGIGFAFFGVPNSFLWGVVAAFSALIPGIGTSLILVPGIIYLFLVGSSGPALGLLIWSILAVGMIDNFLGPRLMGRGMRLHPLLVFLSVFGGLILFGPVGVFLGPLCTSVLFAFLAIYGHVPKPAA